MKLSISGVIMVVLTALVLLPSAHAAGGTRCANPEFASGDLTVTGVSCKAGAKLVHRVLRHPGCKPTADDRANGRGCNGTTRLSGWRCTGLFPGEGYDLTCRKGKHYRVHASAGG